MAAKTFDSTNPSSGALVGTVADQGPDDARLAVDRAADALTAWRSTPAAARARILRCAGQLVLDRGAQLAELITAEQGKPLGEARFEVMLCAEAMTWFADEARRAYGHTIPDPMGNRRLMTTKSPIGVVAAVTPWNIPLLALPRKVVAAAAAGCTVVLKPAEQTSLVALAFAQALADAGLPDGVVNVITTNDPAGVVDALLDDPRVRKLSFTGSTQVGKRLLARAAATVTNVSLELGGNAPVIVFDDADLDVVVADMVGLKTQIAGQNCLAPNRFLVHERIYDDVVARFAERVATVVVGDGSEPGVQMGPLIDGAGLAKVQRHVADALERGAQLVVGGTVTSGTFFPPTVLSHVPTDASAMTEETFGPVYSVASFTDEDEMLEKANATESGLAAYLYTRDLARALRVADRLEFGMVAINENRIASTEAPFGGTKSGGLGRESGHDGLEAYLETKTLAIRA